ncbi:tripartite motif-containing protein 16-like protein [Gambusia affinis]|uniref:tripartite motif-containing protein 16-like protein n=1 Tax=Gambusia affinis TaxID=33528 RepID=UPI001CDBA6DD|nr:tripartite motif-containing protein 16-like protein [Gambusia affinis]
MTFKYFSHTLFHFVIDQSRHTSESFLQKTKQRLCNKARLSFLNTNMAEPHIPVSINHLSCPICTNLLRNPTTIPCGHNFCRDCIQGRWGAKQRDVSCPECRRRFPSRPCLIRNTTLAEMVRDTERGPNRKRKEEESAEAQLKRGRSSADMSGFTLCWRHNKPLDVYCYTDWEIVCADCAAARHSGHRLGPVMEERERKQNELKILQTKLRETLQEQQKQQQNMKKRFNQIEKEAKKTKDDCETVIVEVIDCLQTHCLSVRKLVEDQAKAAAAQINVALEDLEMKIEEKKKMLDDLDLLAQSDNSVVFLQEWPSMQSHCENVLLLSCNESSEDRRSQFDVTKRAIEQIGRKLEDFCHQQFASISQNSWTGEGCKENVEPTTREDFLQYACDLSLDPKTAHKDLIISAGDKQVTRLPGDRSQSPASLQAGRFIHRHQLLCREGLQAERCYYEVELEGDKAEIALAYKGIDRKSSTKKSAFGATENSWSLDVSRSYSVSHRSESVELTQERRGKKIGVYLEFKEGTLSFYEVSDNMKFLYKVQTQFTEPLYPGFWLDCKCCIRICDLKRHKQ